MTEYLIGPASPVKTLPWLSGEGFKAPENALTGGNGAADDQNRIIAADGAKDIGPPLAVESGGDREMPDVVAKLIDTYIAERHDDELFVDTVHRLGIGADDEVDLAAQPRVVFDQEVRRGWARPNPCVPSS